MSYYIESVSYVGPNPNQNLNSDYYTISTLPTRTNLGKEIRTSGWLGTTGDWARYAHGAYDTLEEATAALNVITGDDYRDSPKIDEPIGIDPDTGDAVYALVYRLAGGLEQWGEDSSVSWCYEAMRDTVTAETTDEQIDAETDNLESLANDEGFALDLPAVVTSWTEHRDELRAAAASDK